MLLCIRIACFASTIWWFWPQLAPQIVHRDFVVGPRQAIVVFADDPQRTEFALDLWQQHPEAMIWVLGEASLQRAAIAQMEQRAILPTSAHYRSLLDGEDTVGQLVALSFVLPSSLQSIILVTDRSHRARALAVAQQAIGSTGIDVSAPPTSSLPPLRYPSHSPETGLRLVRDILRVQFWRATGHEARSLLSPFLL